MLFSFETDRTRPKLSEAALEGILCPREIIALRDEEFGQSDMESGVREGEPVALGVVVPIFRKSRKMGQPQS
jgi:hypothetical protein